MTQTARVYGGSLYELAVEEQLVESIGSQMEEIRQTLLGKSRLYEASLRTFYSVEGKNPSCGSGFWRAG